MFLDFESKKSMIKNKRVLKKNVFLKENPAWKVYLLLDFESIYLMIKYKRALKKIIVSEWKSGLKSLFIVRFWKHKINDKI